LAQAIGSRSCLSRSATIRYRFLSAPPQLGTMQKLAFVCVTLLAVTEVANCLRKGNPVEQEDAPPISPKSDLRFVARAPRYYPEDATTVVGYGCLTA